MYCAPGWRNATWITVDDTGARHKAANGFCTQIGNAHFTWFGSTDIEEPQQLSRVDARRPQRLRDQRRGAGLHAPARTLRARRLPAWPNIRTGASPIKTTWNVHLEKLGISALKAWSRRRDPDPVTTATEGALWGSIKAHDFMPNTVIVSDDAGQFNVGQHALCWVHAERLIHKLDTFTR